MPESEVHSFQDMKCYDTAGDSTGPDAGSIELLVFQRGTSCPLVKVGRQGYPCGSGVLGAEYAGVGAEYAAPKEILNN